ncbi:helix-turn-helix domain-containing protein [Rhodoblastus acidophilus]|jgi:predicted transcriptional regulator|uniref:Helix-turn-helix domain-containing protein n=1 Tax=Candidatus Rhodoblastus alkanivorans TaxID=2954117 RepID=A0ABS9ZD10_9HYPH|nr:helix-turn-helix domain-containing protein [Candidatus Rhodoblastus alkanivorans]MCI4680611.1 helix-turn-helix domain-containing protein [Candidatus Rhodoblastus alkanivorans]MCI4684947.1 helix-turn-helix domain-containing protein [Candidatus Rhodoblastus alkanivorans]MDI4643161.1 helix-turn-helix domain-containing protein [Rhodoblastus acidophilus]
MDGTTQQSSETAGPTPFVRTTNKASAEKWGQAVMDLGFCLVPSLLLRAQRRLNLNPTQLAVLLQLCDFWWDKERKPFPSKETLSQRLSLSERQIQRYIAELEQEGLVKRIERRAANGGKLSNTYDLSGLVKRLQSLEPEFREVEEASKAARKAVSKRGYKPPARQTSAKTTSA